LIPKIVRGLWLFTTVLQKTRGNIADFTGIQGKIFQEVCPLKEKYGTEVG